MVCTCMSSQLSQFSFPPSLPLSSLVVLTVYSFPLSQFRTKTIPRLHHPCIPRLYPWQLPSVHRSNHALLWTPWAKLMLPRQHMSPRQLRPQPTQPLSVLCLGRGSGHGMEWGLNRMERKLRALNQESVCHSKMRRRRRREE